MPWVLASGFMLILSWPVNGVAPLLLVAFVPLLLLQHHLQDTPNANAKIFRFSYLSFLLWNVGTTWWVYKATLAGAIMAFVCNSLFMAVVFLLFHVTKKKWGYWPGLLSLPVYWIAFEYLHHRWDLSWPWLSLGNGFSEYYKWVQWYEYTGTLGGSLWILLSNLFFFDLYNRLKLGTIRGGLIWKISVLLLWVAAPIVISFIIYANTSDQGKVAEVVIIQPNIDPYNEKFTAMSGEDQLNKLLEISKPLLSGRTEYVITPETALPFDHREEALSDDPDILAIKNYLSAYPRLKFIGGISSSHFFSKHEAIPPSARKLPDADVYYEYYNTSMQVDKMGKVQLYHKSRLVPGVELMPYPSLFGFLDSFAIDLGGTVGSYGRQKERSVFNSEKFKVAVPICYESIYGEFMGGFIKNGADFIFIITNDGWWGDTPGYKQHLSYARLRALEFRRSIARSANTGISAIINQRGDIVSRSDWWKPAALKGTLYANREMTFYGNTGDYIGIFLSIIAVTLLVLHTGYVVAGRLKKERETKKNYEL